MYGRLCLILYCVFLACSAFGTGMGGVICHGNSRISTETILSYAKLSPGENAHEEQMDSALKALFATGFFADVKISTQGNKIVIEVIENPLINKVGFDGNNKISSEDLSKEIISKSNTVLSMSRVQMDINRMNELYKKIGRYSALIEPKIIKLDQNRVNLVFEIVEGKEAVIQKINFAGNKSFRAAELAEVLVSKEYRFYRFFSNADVYDPDKIEFDKELLIKFYENRGYADFRIHSAVAELSKKRDGFLITFSFSEGQRYSFGEFNLSGALDGFDLEHLRPLIQLKSGDMFSRDKIDQTITAMVGYLGDHGYPFIEIDAAVTTYPETGLADVTFQVGQSSKMYIRRLNIKNNTRTLDKVIRREFRLAEGDPYNVTKMQRSEQRVRNLGYFEKVEIRNVRTEEPDKLDVDVQVEEKSTGSINFAGGYNSVSGALGHVMLSENNFLGKGQQVQVGGSVGQKERSFKFSFTEPYFMNRDLAVGFDVFKSRQDMRSVSSYNSIVSGFSVRAGYDLSENLSHVVRYFYKREVIKGVSPDASIYVKEQQGKHIISAVGHSLTYDKLDNAIEPTSGYNVSVDQDLAGVGGKTRYLSHKATAMWMYPLYKKDVLLKVTNRAGHIMGYGGKKVSLNDRFFIGPDYMRGFEMGGIGPRANNKDRDALGGNVYYTLSTDIAFPVGLPNEVGLRGVVFNDIGALHTFDSKVAKKDNIFYKKNLRASAGIGLIWKSPLGTISMYYATPYKKERFDDVKRFYIDFGAGF
jgi:outer membrane protein insertion porin family